MMEYQKIINLFDNTSDQLSKFKTKNQAEKNDRSYGEYNTSRQTKFKTSMISSCFCDYSGTYILVKRTNQQQSLIIETEK